MSPFFLRWFISALGLWVASAIVPGVTIQGFSTLLIAALLLGLVNAIVRPIIVLLTLPLTFLTLGLFLLVINAAMVGLVALLLDGFQLSGFFSAASTTVVASLVSWLASRHIGPRGCSRIDMEIRTRRMP